jgi:hypothetical protein
VAGADAIQALRHEASIVVVEAHDIRDGTERDQIEQMRELGLWPRRERAARAQFGAQLEHGVEHHADTREMLARKAAPGLIRIDDAGGVGQLFTRQMVVGNQHLQTETLGFIDAFHRADAIVDGDQEIRAPLGGQPHDLRRQAVAELESIRHDVVDIGPHLAQR